MRNVQEFPGRRSGLARILPAYRRPGSRGGSSRIRYAHGGAFPRVEPYCAVPQGTAVHYADGGAAGIATDTSLWLAEPPVGGRQGDVWMLVCGGIAAAAAFAAAFVASGGVASHPAAPPARMPAVVRQACPTAAP